MRKWEGGCYGANLPITLLGVPTPAKVQWPRGAVHSTVPRKGSAKTLTKMDSAWHTVPERQWCPRKTVQSIVPQKGSA